MWKGFFYTRKTYLVVIYLVVIQYIGIEKRQHIWRFARFLSTRAGDVLGNHLTFEKSPLLWHISGYPMSQDSLYEFSVYHYE